ncbi:hypothetical protein V2J52_01415 [Georgenia sp. MJ173]|uniref:hypothetical protein n=1 Tax=Georgenia sunbinii TaxID=3117728 RepID=UPI002F26BF18
MRQSLSETASIRRPAGPTPGSSRGATGAVVSAIALTVVLLGAAIIDHAGARSLLDHAAAAYASYGTSPDPALLYGIVYTVSVVGLLLWLPVLRAARRGRRWAPIAAGTATVVTGMLALTLLFITEYGAPIFPPLWGALALLPALAGAVAVVLLVRRPARREARGG